MKTSVYSWRISPETRSRLEDRAREEGKTLATLLDEIARDWLNSQHGSVEKEERRQARVRARMLSACGSIAGGDPKRSKRARHELRRRLRLQHGR
jgi:hypothetical protein